MFSKISRTEGLAMKLPLKYAAVLAAAFVVTDAVASDLASLLTGTGVWLQSPRKLTSTDLGNLKTYHIGRIHLMATDPQEKTPTVCTDNRGALPTAKASHLTGLLSAAKAEGLKAIATFYVYPRRTEIEQLTNPSDGIVKRLLDAGAESIEYDLEGQWSKHPACGYANHADALKGLIERTRALRPGLSVGITTHTGRFPDERIDFGTADYISLQAYSTCKPGDCPEWNAHDGPGKKQERALKALSTFKKPSIIGLAAYQQSWPGHSINEAMARSRDAAMARIGGSDIPTLGISYWSSRWILPKGSAEGAFLKSQAP